MGKDILHRVGNGGCCGCETVSPEVMPQVEIPEKLTQGPPCFAITIGVRLRSHTNQTLNSQQTPHISSSRANYGVSVVSILEKIGGVITTLHCIWDQLCR